MGREEDLSNPYYVRMMEGPAGRFGQYVMARGYDAGMQTAEGIVAGTSKAKTDQELHRRIAGLTADEKASVLDISRSAIIAALHGLLHGISHDRETIRVNFEGHDIADHSDGLEGDLFWWLRDLSKHPYDAETDLGLA